jgi:aminoglycoside 2'-N-acetyltransferase I
MIEIELVEYTETTEEFLRELRQLLDKAFGNRFSEADWDHALGGTHIVVREFGSLVSHVAVVPRRLYVGDNVYACGYVEAVATLPSRQNKGYAALAMGEARKIIEIKYQVGALSTSAKDYYRQFGWEDWQGPSYVVTADQWIRSKSEDCGIMVLRLEASSELELSSRIGCEMRSGDSW